MIAVVDYHKGNLKSVERGLIAAGGDAFITDDVAAIAKADAIVLPGVGAFADAAATMCELGQMDVLREAVERGVPFLGICLGMHLMFEEGEEGEIVTGEDEDPIRPKGLAILPGVVGHLPRTDAEGDKYKIPHVGWNSISVPGAAALPECSVAQTVLSSHEKPTGLFGSCGTRLVSTPEGRPQGGSGAFNSPLFDGIPQGEFFYFTHSYAIPDTPATVAVTTHSITFPCAVQYKDRVFGVQFHPEKSSDAGARMLQNFVRVVNEI